MLRESGAPRFAESCVLSLLLLLAIAVGISGCGEGDVPRAAVSIRAFEVEPDHLDIAGEVTLRWETQQATSITILRGQEPLPLGDERVAQGAITVAISETTTFTLTARGGSGRSVSEERTVTVASHQAPLIGALIAPEVVGADEAGEARATIGWSGVKFAAGLRLETPGQAPVELDPRESEGSLEVLLHEETTFTLIATNSIGKVSRSVTIRVVGPPTIERFAADRALVGSGEAATVRWATANTSWVELWLNGSSIEAHGAPEGSKEFVFTFTSTLELRAFNEAGHVVSATLELEVGAPEILDFQFSSDSVWLGEATTISWQTQGGTMLEVILLGSEEEILCDAHDLESIAAASCLWPPLVAGIHFLELRVSNLSGVDTLRRELFAAGGPLITHFDADPTVLTAGDEVEFHWIVRGDPAGNEPQLSLADDKGTTYVIDGAKESFTTTLSAPGPYEFLLEATTNHPSADPAQATVALLVHPSPEVQFEADPPHFDDSISDGVLLSWTSQDAESLVLYQWVDEAWVELFEIEGPDRVAGSHRIIPRVAERYRLLASNAIGATTSAELEVTVAPLEVMVVEATPDAFTQGQEIRLRWEARMADEVTIDVTTKGYLLEETDAPYLELPGMGGTQLPLTTQCGAVDTLGCAELIFPDDFVFPLGPDRFSRVWVHTPGYLSFGSGGQPGASRTNNQTFPTPSADKLVHIAPFWDNLGWDPVRYPIGNVYWALIEEDGERALAIQWKDIGYSHLQYRTASFNFEVVLREDGSFDFRYGAHLARDSNIPANFLAGALATIGWQLLDQSDFGLVSFNGQPSTHGPRDHRTFSYRPLDGPLPTRGELAFAPLARQEAFPITVTATRDGASASRSVVVSVSRKPLLDLSQDEIPPVAIGEEFRLGWKSFNASSLVILDGEGAIRCTAPNQAQVDEGVCGLVENAAGRHAYVVRATGAHGAVAERIVTVDVFGDFGVASFTAGAEAIEKGGDVLLRWEVFGAAMVTLFAGEAEIFRDPTGASTGSFLVEGMDEETEFHLFVTNDVGAVDEASVTVGLWDVVIEVSPRATRVRAGDPVTFIVNAYDLDLGAPVYVYGLLPLSEVPPPEARYTDVSGLSGAVDHPINPTASSSIVDIDFPEGFVFPYMGSEYTGLRAFVDGYVSFNRAATVYGSSQELPTDLFQGINVHLAPFWDDLHPRAVGKVHSARIDDETFIIQWSRMSLSQGSANNQPDDLNFQLVLHRSGIFEYRYGTMAPNPTYRPPQRLLPQRLCERGERSGCHHRISVRGRNDRTHLPLRRDAARSRQPVGPTRPQQPHPPLPDRPWQRPVHLPPTEDRDLRLLFSNLR